MGIDYTRKFQKWLFVTTKWGVDLYMESTYIQQDTIFNNTY